MISLDVGEAVHVVHRQTKRALQPGLRCVTHPVEPRQLGAIGKMKSSDRVEGLLAALGLKKVVSAQPPRLVQLGAKFLF